MRPTRTRTMIAAMAAVSLAALCAAVLACMPIPCVKASCTPACHTAPALTEDGEAMTEFGTTELRLDCDGRPLTD